MNPDIMDPSGNKSIIGQGGQFHEEQAKTSAVTPHMCSLGSVLLEEYDPLVYMTMNDKEEKHMISIFDGIRAVSFSSVFWRMFFAAL